ncbi:hypothetical protein [Thermoplasma sp.]|uniref:hypothetical protein n=1 Tax=Thermoplasma sp. TaxID=1973142 RepID=UPI002636ADC9|nr:hypothetical protein [Thermoplasma sp.]
MRSELFIDDRDCDPFLKTISPDNYGNIKMECNSERIKITIDEDKYGTVFTLLDDILRNYEVFKKIRDLMSQITVQR